MTKLVQVPKEKLRAKRSLHEIAEKAGAPETSLLAVSSFDETSASVKPVDVAESPAGVYITSLAKGASRLARPRTSSAETYLSSLAEGPSRSSGRAALKKVANVFADLYLEQLGKSRDDLTPAMSAALDVFAFPWHLLDRALVARLRARLQDTCAPASANHYLSCLRGTLKACADSEQMTYEAMHRALSGAKRVKGVRKKAGRALELEEVQALFKQCDDSAIGRRDAAMLTLMCACGLRVSEAASVKFKDLKDDGMFTFVGKGNKEREMFLSKEFFGHMRDWIKVRGRDPGPIVLACDEKSERGLTRVGIYFRVVDLAKRAGIPHISPHDLRRTFFTTILDGEGVDPFTVADLGGHDDVKTTTLYNRVKQTKKRETMEKFHAKLGKFAKTSKGTKKR